MTEKHETFVRIPVRFVDGAWVTESGRRLTASDGTVADFVVRQDAMSELWPKRVVHEHEYVQFLEQGGALRIALRVRQPDELRGALLKHLVPFGDMFGQVEWGSVKGWHSTEARFFEIKLGEPTEGQLDVFPDFSGGLMVGVRGWRIEDIAPSLFELPEAVSERQPLSLNHAYTLLSEIYEIHRASHTGSIYQTVFYRGEGGRWYPLDLLREIGIALSKGIALPSEEMANEFWSSVNPLKIEEIGK